jgi:glycolate oxidase iron-sulfur subunit
MSLPEDWFIDENKSLACVHCGLCLPACPTYLETGNENDSPRGRIYLMRAIQNGRLPINDITVRHIDLCLGCRACETACPSGVEYGNLIELTRDYLEQKYSRSWFQAFLRRFAIEQIFPFPWRIKLALFPARLIRFLGITILVPKIARPALELMPDKMRAVKLALYTPAKGNTKGRVAFFEGCVMQVMFGDTNQASVNLLAREGWEICNPQEQACCGALYAHSGQLEKARKCARNNIAAFEKHEIDAIVTNAAGCGSTLKNYRELLKGDDKWEKRAEKFSTKVKDLTEWISKKYTKQDLTAEKVTYLDACHLAHAQAIKSEPRSLVNAVAGKQFVELPEADICCGSAGSYNLVEPDMAARLQKRKVDNIISTGADVVVTSNPGCLLQIQAGLKKEGSSIVAMHIADYLTEHAE